MALPIVKVTLPSVLAGQSNGRIAPNLLTRINMPGGGTAEVLAQAAPKWSALLAAAAQAGFAFSHEGDYRTYNEQVALFEQRFTTTYRAGATTRSWNGQTWYLKAGYALAAVPGTSNHGWGLALDLCMSGGESITQAAVNWLTTYASAFGMSAEVSSEPWHWRPYDGDNYTAAVAAYSEGSARMRAWPKYGDKNSWDVELIIRGMRRVPGVTLPLGLDYTDAVAATVKALGLCKGGDESGKTWGPTEQDNLDAMLRDLEQSSGGVTEEQAHRIAEQEIADAKATVTLTPTE